jgi:hypothetical protein
MPVPVSPNKWRTSVCPILPSMALNVLKAMTGGWNIMHGWNTNGIRFLNFVRWYWKRHVIMRLISAVISLW